MTEANQWLQTPPGAVFTDKVRPLNARAPFLARAREMFGDTFQDPPELTEWFNYIFVPTSLAWAFKPNGKTGTTSTLHALFELEFGVPLTVSHREPDGIAQDHAAHRLAVARVFSSLTDLRGPSCALAVLDRTLRLTTVRHPTNRAGSAFRYLCKAEAAQVSRFLPERLRMNAIVGFDWSRHANTTEGFLRFLDFVEHELEGGVTRPLDWHLRPQVMNVRPDILKPDIVGRTEDLGTFFARIAERLDRPLPDSLSLPVARNTTPATSDFGADPSVKARIARIFAADFEAFGYDP